MAGLGRLYTCALTDWGDEGCPLSPALFGLYIDGMHCSLMSLGLVDVPVLSSGVQVPNLAYADDVALMAP